MSKKNIDLYEKEKITYVSTSGCPFMNSKGNIQIKASLLVCSTWEARPPVRKLAGECGI